MSVRIRVVLTAVTLAMAAVDAAAQDAAPEAPKTTGSITGYYYFMRDEPDFSVGVATLDYGALHLEGRYNYEVSNAGSAFVGWKFSGGETVTYEVTPIVGGLFGAGRGFIPGVEASVAWKAVDAYIEAEYVDDRAQPGSAYYYAWCELGYRPVEWLRIGLVGQRTHEVNTGRDLQRGVFAQATWQKATLSVYVFNPDDAARYVIASLGLRF
jgi:hypothetical protein